MAEQVQISGLDEFRAALRAAAAAEPKASAKANTKIAKLVAAEAQMFAVGEGRQQAHFAKFISGRGTRDGATVGLRGRTANAAFWGAKRHTGWYATKPGPSQFKPWIGNNWQVGAPGQGPYAINPAIAHESDNIIRSYSEMVDEITNKAFPK